MVFSKSTSVVAVISAVVETQQSDFDNLNIQCQSDVSWIKTAFEQCKRKWMQCNGIEEESRKRRKAGSISDYQTSNKENSNPNVGTYQNTENEVIDSTNSVDVMAMKVADLREALRLKGLSTNGLKKELQHRLQRALDAESSGEIKVISDNNHVDGNGNDEDMIKDCVEEDEVVIKSTKDTKMDLEITKKVDVSATSDVTMEDIEESEVIDDHNNETSDDVGIAEKGDIQPVAQSTKKDINESIIENNIASAALEEMSSPKHPLRNLLQKVFSPGATKNSAKKSKKADNTMEVPNIKTMNISDIQTSQEVKNSKSAEKQVLNNENLQSKIAVDDGHAKENDESNDKVGSLKAVQATPAVSKIPIDSLSSQTKLYAMKAARKQRLEEIRNKVNLTKSQLNGTATPASLSAQSGKKANVMPETSIRKQQIANEIRSKVAASQNTTNSMPKPKVQEIAHVKQTNQVAKKPLSPMDTYEMSDRDDSDSEGSEYEERDQNKKIPKWAQKQYLYPALQKQFGNGPNKIDPDEIFPEVSTCDLEAIFEQRKKKYKQRSSSGNWAKDGMTAHERLVYKRKMGFQK